MRINDPRSNFAVWVKEIQDRKLINAVFKQRSSDGQGYDLIAVAREADLGVDLSRRILRLNMRNGTLMYRGTTNGYFVDRMWEIPLPPSVGLEKSNKPRDLTWAEIGEIRAELVAKCAKQQESFDVVSALAKSGLGRCRREVADILAVGPCGPLHVAAVLPIRGTGVGVTNNEGVVNEVLLEQLPIHAEQSKILVKYTTAEILALDAEKQMRPALAFGCLCFVMVGCPVGIWFSRSDYLSAFITCFLPIVFLYYPLMLCGTNLAKDGKLDPLPAIWFADAVLVVISLFLFQRLLKN
jgi:hypothetical protein